MGHHFNPDIAERYGIEEAILFENIYYWCEKNKANNQNFHDGNYWTYNSIKAFASMFKYMSEKKITSALKNLEDAGVIIAGCYNANPYDRTKWYAITDLGLSIYPKSKMESPKQENESTQNGQMNVTDINTNINTNIKPDRETKNMNPPSLENEGTDSGFSVNDTVQSECLDEVRKTYEEIHRRWVKAKLPLSKSSVTSYFVFSCRELKAALGGWMGMCLTPDDYLDALDNYILVAELITKGESWMETVGGFDFFGKHILDFLTGTFVLDKYKKKAQGEKTKSEDSQLSVNELMEKYGIVENH